MVAGTFHDDKVLEVVPLSKSEVFIKLELLAKYFYFVYTYSLKAAFPGFGRHVGSKIENASRTGASS